MQVTYTFRGKVKAAENGHTVERDVVQSFTVQAPNRAACDKRASRTAARLLMEVVPAEEIMAEEAK